MSRESPKIDPNGEHAILDPEHWHGPIISKKEVAEINFLRELVKDGFATERIYADKNGDTILEIRELIRNAEGKLEEGRIVRMENETLVGQLLDKDEHLKKVTAEHNKNQSPFGIILDAGGVSLLSPLPGEKDKKGN